MPIVYGLNMIGPSFATLSAHLVWISSEHRHVMADTARRVPRVIKEPFSRLSPGPQEDDTGAPEVPMWWYLIGCLLVLFMAIFAVEYWDGELRWYGVLLACVVALVFNPPASLQGPQSIAYADKSPAAGHGVCHLQSEDQH